MRSKISIKAPGRICLFGEHQDYLDLPVISAAISLYIYIDAIPNNLPRLNINYLDLNEKEVILLNNKELKYEDKRDYIKSVYNILLRNGYTFNQGYDCQIHGDIPINAGAASSSALVVAFTKFLSEISNARFKLKEIAEIAHSAEVREFREHGGKMDHYTSSFGNVLYIKTKSPISIENLKVSLDGFVLGDSLTKKTTVKDLYKVKTQVLEGINYLKRKIPNFDLNTTELEEIINYLDDSEKAKKVYAQIVDRDLTQQARKILLNKESFDKRKLGELLNEHHYQLKENLKISTRKIDSMINASLAAGALGGKINGSGFGGTMFAYAPGNEERVAEAIKKCGGVPYIVKIAQGVNCN